MGQDIRVGRPVAVGCAFFSEASAKRFFTGDIYIIHLEGTQHQR